MGLTGTFTYRITGPDGFDEMAYIIIDDSSASYTEYGSVTLTVPAGEITVTEISGSDFVCTFPFDYQHTVQVPLQNSVAVEFVNTPLDASHSVGNIDIVKNVEAGLYGTFEFLITLPDDYTPQHDTVFEHNAYITISEGDTGGLYTLHNVPAGLSYTVTEMPDESSICIDPSSYMGTVAFSQGDTGIISFTNIPGSYLEIRKYVTGGIFGTFEFTISGSDEFQTTATVTIEEGNTFGSIIIEVPAGDLFVSEVFSFTGEWIPEPYYTSTSVTPGQTATVEFINSPNSSTGDTIPPTTAIILDPASPDGDNGWYRENVHVTVSSSDAGGTVTETRSVLDPVTPPATFADIPAGNPYGDTGADVAGDGIHAVYAASIDNSGNMSPVVSATFRIDSTPPVVTIVLPDAGWGPGIYILNQEINAEWVAADDGSGIVSPDAGTLVIDTSSPGQLKVLAVPAGTAVDNAGNLSAEITLTYSVQYAISSFLPPLGPGPKVFKAGSTIPVKFYLTDAGGTPVSTASGTVSINTIPGASAVIRYDEIAGQYIANLKIPRGATPGGYTITVILDDGTTHTIEITIR